MTTHKHRVIPWLAYPGAMVSAFLVYALLDAQSVSVMVSAYVAVVFGAAAVTLLEFIIPYDRAWQPDRGDVKNDLLFMVAET